MGLKPNEFCAYGVCAFSEGLRIGQNGIGVVSVHVLDHAAFFLFVKHSCSKCLAGLGVNLGPRWYTARLVKMRVKAICSYSTSRSHQFGKAPGWVVLLLSSCNEQKCIAGVSKWWMNPESLSWWVVDR